MSDPSVRIKSIPFGRSWEIPTRLIQGVEPTVARGDLVLADGERLATRHTVDELRELIERANALTAELSRTTKKK